MAKLADATLSATGTVRQAEDALLLAHAEQLGIDASRLVSELRALGEEDRRHATLVITSPRAGNSRWASSRIRAASEWLRDVFARAGIHALERGANGYLADAIDALDCARSGAFHATVVHELSREAASDEDILATLGLRDGASDTDSEIMRVRERIASEVAGIARRIATQVGMGSEHGPLVLFATREVLNRELRDPKDPPPNTFVAEEMEVERDGMLSWDAALVAELIAMGAKELADRVADQSRYRWSHRHDLRWFDDGEPSPAVIWRAWQDPTEDGGPIGAPFLLPLTKAAWERIVRPAVERERKNRPALVIQVHEDVTRIHSRTHVIEDVSGQRSLVFDAGDPIAIVPPVPTVDAEVFHKLAASIQRGAAMLGSVPAHKALRWEISEGHARVINGVPDARTLVVDGGWSVFAHDYLGMSKKGAADDLRDIVRAQSAVRLTLPDGSFGNMLALRESEARGRRRGRIEVVLGTMLLPHYTFELSDKLSGRALNDARRLVPVVGLPPFVGRANEHGAQTTLSMLVVREMRIRATELVTHGGVAIDLDRWARLAMEAGVKPNTLPALIDRWTRDGDDAPAFLRVTAPGRYTLGDADLLARAFLEAAGRASIGASEAGRKAVEAREKARLGQGGSRRRGRHEGE